MESQTFHSSPFPRGGYAGSLTSREGRTDFCARQPFAQQPLKWTKAKAGRLTLGRTDADGGADIADRLTEWRSIATDALRAKGPSINDVHILSRVAERCPYANFVI